MSMPSFTNLFSGTSSPKESDNKRGLGDTSIVSNESVSQTAITERPFLNLSDSDNKDSEQSLIKALEQMFSNFQSSIEVKLNVISDKLDSFDTRLSTIEERASSHELAVTNLTERVSDIERFNEQLEERFNALPVSSSVTADWEPAGSPVTKILLLGDSNSGGKVKFGQGKGTLGAALPGDSIFVPKVDQLIEPQDDVFNNISDLVVAVGTNDLKEPQSNAVSLAKKTYSYVKKVIEAHPSCHVFLPGVPYLEKPG